MASKSGNPDDWRISFPTLEAYRDDWIRQAKESQKLDYAEDVLDGIHRATSLTEIEINGDIAIAHKKFDGEIRLTDGGKDVLNWQTLYFCRKVDGRVEADRVCGISAVSDGNECLSRPRCGVIPAKAGTRSA